MEKKAQVNMYLAMTLECNMSWFTGFPEEALPMRSRLTCPAGGGTCCGAGGGAANYIYIVSIEALMKNDVMSIYFARWYVQTQKFHA
jgi:hypothetical protein